MGNGIDTKFTIPVQPVKPGLGVGKDDRAPAKRIGEKPEQHHEKRKQPKRQKNDDHIDEYV